LIFLIKELMFFTKGGSCSLPRGWGAPVYKLKKLCTIQKVKTKKWLCTIGKIKTKKLENYVQFEKKNKN